jgi:hypothetical protein
MKTLLIGITLLCSSFSFANESILDNLKTLPRISNQKIVVNYGPEFAAVQPTAHINFDFASCRQFNFSVEIIDGDDVNFLKISFPRNQADCRALPIKRTYGLQISSDYMSTKPFVVLNPIGSDLPNFREVR